LPVGSDFVSDRALVATFVTVTAAAGTMESDESLIVPKTEPVNDCALAI
jgi:hypothetical protein